jgi:Glycosyl hydrolase catalytic core
MVSPLNRLLVAALALACLCAASGAAVALANPAPRLGNAVAVGTGKIDGFAGICAQRAKRMALRSSSGASASSSSAGRSARKRTKRRAKELRRRCLKNLRRQSRPRAATKSVPLPEAGPLTLAIDGGYGGWSETELEEREALGAAVTRHEWDTSEPVDAQDDVVLAAAAEVHTRIHALLGENDLGDANSYREWVVDFIRRYGPGGAFWSAHPELDGTRYAITSVELGNEPYFGEMSAAEYADAVRPALEEIHRLGLPVKVILDSRVYGSDTSWMDTLYARIPDLNSLFYAFADHPYWYGHDPSETSPAGPFDRIETLRKRMIEQGSGNKPIWITEYGESTANCGEECVDEATQADHLQEMISAVATHPEWGVEMLSVYQLRDRGTDSGDRERQFGLLREDGSEKPAYGVVEAAVQQYRG